MHNGNDAPPWPIYAWYAAGGLRSTAQDMLSFGEANLGHNEVNGKPVSAELTAAMQLAQKPIYTMPNGFNKQAMAWVVNTGDGNPNLHPVIVKDGGTVGFSTAIAINPLEGPGGLRRGQPERARWPPARGRDRRGTCRRNAACRLAALRRRSSTTA